MAGKTDNTIDIMGPKMTMIVGLVAQAIIGFFMSGFYTQ